MANLKNITELPVAQSADGLNLIVNDNGAAKQIAANVVGAQADWNMIDETNPAFIKNKPAIVQSDWAEVDEKSPAFIKNKPSREIVYEWFFDKDNPTSFIIENLNQDFSWLVKRDDRYSFEINVEFCAYEEYVDIASGEVIDTILHDDTTMILGNHNMYGASLIKAPMEMLEKADFFTGWLEFDGFDYSSEEEDVRKSFKLVGACQLIILNNYHLYLESQSWKEVKDGCALLIMGEGPIKSVKIIKNSY